MNIFNKVALQGLLKSRTRTIVTIIGVMLSAAMMIGVATFATSLQHYMVNGSILKYGDWHVSFYDVDDQFRQQQLQDERVANMITFENIGYATLEQSKNEQKPYAFVAGFLDETYENLPITLTSGRYPANETELLVPSHVKDNAEIALFVGDQLTLNVGQRVVNDQLLSQQNAYQGAVESITSSSAKTFIVVGTYTRPTFEPSTAPGFTLITTIDELPATSSFSTFVKLKKPRQVQDYAQSMNVSNYTYNDEVLRFMGLSNDKLFNTLLYSVGAILVALIMLGSVLLIYNAFTISLNERMRQFGILLSVGATSKQLRNSVLFEGLCIGFVGIPLGLFIGIPSVSTVLAIVSKNFSNFAYSGVPLTLHVSMPILFIAILISLATILLSAYLPARKAAKTPVMTCIRQTNEVKVSTKDIKTNKGLEQLLGLERTLALKNFKRNKRRYRTIVLSLTLSVVMFVSANAFKTTLQQAANSSAVDTDYDLLFMSEMMKESEAHSLFEKFKDVNSLYDGSYQAMTTYTAQVPLNELSDDFLSVLETTETNETVDVSVDVQFLEDDVYFTFLEQLGLHKQDYTGEQAKAIAVAKVFPTNAEDYQDIFTKQAVSLEIAHSEFPPQMVDLTLVDTYPVDGLPKKPSEVTPYTFMIVVPYEQIDAWGLAGKALDRGLTFQSTDTTTAVAEMEQIAQAAQLSSEYTFYNANEIFEQNRNIIFIIDLFTIVFIIMISLIAVANVFNTISTNIRLRRRELAMLRSIGLSDRDFNKMMRFECALYGIQTLLFGVPISSLFAWLIYKGMFAGGADVEFMFPWSSIAISVIGVFIIIFITTMYALAMIKKENIIDALRDDVN